MIDWIHAGFINLIENIQNTLALEQVTSLFVIQENYSYMTILKQQHALNFGKTVIC